MNNLLNKQKGKRQKNISRIILITTMLLVLTLLIGVSSLNYSYALQEVPSTQGEVFAPDSPLTITPTDPVNQPEQPGNTNQQTTSNTQNNLDQPTQPGDGMGQPAEDISITQTESPLTEEYTSTTVESIKAGISDETLSFTNLLIIVLISVNIVLLILAITILMQAKKKM